MENSEEWCQWPHLDTDKKLFQMMGILSDDDNENAQKCFNTFRSLLVVTGSTKEKWNVWGL